MLGRAGFAPPSPLLSFPLQLPLPLKSLLSPRAGAGAATVTACAALALHKDEESRERRAACKEGVRGPVAALDPRRWHLLQPLGDRRLCRASRVSHELCLSPSFVSSVRGFP